MNATSLPFPPGDNPTRAYDGFRGHVGRTFGGSEPYWPRVPPQAPDRAPNVVVILADDLGFADLGCYGSEIDTPNLDRLAAEGLRYTNFHVNPMCSPTRASLLTGLNAHRAGVGHVCHSDAGFPGYAMELTDEMPTLAELFREHGWATLMVGKWHLCKDSHLGDSGPKHSWPCQKGFDRFYGILDGFTNFHQPHRLYQDNHHVEVDRYPDGYYFTDDITDRAITMVRDVKAHRPGQPFFLYFAHGAVHAPLQAKPDDLTTHRGRYDQGWDEVRRARFERQKALGLLPVDTVLPARNAEAHDDVGPWDELGDDERRQFARYMEIYAAMVDSVDQSVGRLLDAIDELGELDNTIVVFTSDNGASREGESQGTSAYFRTLAVMARGGQDAAVEDDLAAFELLGGPRTLPHYPRGWAMACNTPFRLYKTHTYAGGHQVPFIAWWGRSGRLPAGELRTQYQHVTDLLPTLCELAGVQLPTEHRGRPALPLAGASMVATLHDAAAPSTHPEQYYELEGRRGLYRDGWEVVTNHHGQTDFGDHEWALFDLTTDPTETTDRRDDHPDRLRELADAWEQAAWANQVYPLDEGWRVKWIQRPAWESVYEQPVTLRPGTPTLERYRAMKLVSQRSYHIAVRFGVGSNPADQGILVAHGDQGGGYVVYVEDGRVHYVHNGGGPSWHLDGGQIGAGDHLVEVDVENTGEWRLTVRLVVDGDERDRADGLPMLAGMAPFEGIDVGLDRRSPVSWDLFERHGCFPYTGRIDSVTYTPGEPAPDAGERWLEFMREQARRFE